MKKAYRLIGLVILAVILTKIDFKKLVLCFSEINAAMFIFVNIFTILGLFIKAFRWRQILKIQSVNYSMVSSFFSYLGGLCAGIITPGRTGEAMRACYLKEETGVPLSRGLASVFVDRIFDLSVLLAFSAAGLFFLHSPALTGARTAIFYLSALAVFIIAVLSSPFLRIILKKFFLAAFPSSGAMALEDNLRQFFSCVKSTLSSRKIYIVFFLTALAYVFYFLQCCLLARIAHINIHWIKVIFFVSISGLLALLPVTVLGLGTREASLVFLFSLSGIQKEAALTYSFLLFLSFYILTGLMAYIGWFLKYRVTKTICVNG